jgi:hypothetical protein
MFRENGKIMNHLDLKYTPLWLEISKKIWCVKLIILIIMKLTLPMRKKCFKHFTHQVKWMLGQEEYTAVRTMGPNNRIYYQ